MCWPLYDRGRGGRSCSCNPACSPVSGAPSSWGGENDGGGNPSTTPIKHVVVIIGENHTFDNVFGTFQPPPGQSVLNLLSEGIVNADGTPGPNAAKAEQDQATDTASPGHAHGDGCLPHRAPTQHDVRRSACDGGQGQNSPDTRFPARPAERAVSDHEVRALLRPARRVPTAPANSTARSSATRSTASTRCTRMSSQWGGRSLDMGPRARRRHQWGPAAVALTGVDRPGRARHGLLQHGARDAPTSSSSPIIMRCPTTTTRR